MKMSPAHLFRPLRRRPVGAYVSCVSAPRDVEMASSKSTAVISASAAAGARRIDVRHRPAKSWWRDHYGVGAEAGNRAPAEARVKVYVC